MMPTQRFYRTIIVLCFVPVLLLVLVACGGDDSPSAQTTAGDGVIRWERDPLHVVFRAEVTGGVDMGSLPRLSEVPLCTIYGDGRLVWLRETNFEDEVLFDQLDENAIVNFITYITVDERIYTFEEGYRFQVPRLEVPVYQRLMVDVNDRRHVTDEFADWPPDYGYFERMLEACKDLARTPRTFVPSGAWLSVEITEYSRHAPEVVWEPEAAGLSFEEIYEEGGRRWIEGDNVIILWNLIRDNSFSIQFYERGNNYRIALQVPGVTIDAPAAPQN